MMKPELQELMKSLYDRHKIRKRNGVYCVWVNCDPPWPDPLNQRPPEQHLYLLAGSHGQEFAGPLALVELLKEEWRWPNVSMCAVIQDPKGYEQEGYGFIGPDGRGTMWPPLWRYPKNEEMYWFYMDENSAWGNNLNVPPRHVQMRGLMEQLPPTFVLTLHETVRSEIWRDPFWVGAGLLLIEAYPMSLLEFSGAIDPIGSPGTSPLVWAARTLREWFSPLWKERRWVRSSRALEDNPGFQLVSRIAARYEDEYKQRLTGDAWMRYQEATGQPTVGPGRIIHRPEQLQSEWKTATDFSVGKYGCPAITTESFPSAELGLRGLDDRVEQQRTFVEATLDILNDNKDYQI